MAEPSLDLYGFKVKLTPQQETVRDSCDKSSENLQRAWMPFIGSETLPPESKLKEMIRKGVPPTVRPWVWMASSGAAKKKGAAAKNYYHIMLAASENSKYLKEIEMDVPHTFSNHPWLQGEDGQAAMRKVLAAYSMHNDKIGYCRSMNNIVGMLLVVLNRNEETAFWLLSALVEGILHPGTYARNLEGCQVEMRALDELMGSKMPALHAHMHALDADISILATDWFLCLYCNSLPAETTARVWDALFHEGPKILFRVALALLKMNEEAIMALKDAGEVLMLMRSAAAEAHNRDLLMLVAFDGIGSLPMSTIEKYRDIKTREVEEIMRARGVESISEHSAAPPPTNDVEDLTNKVKEGFGKLGKFFSRKPSSE